MYAFCPCIESSLYNLVMNNFIFYLVQIYLAWMAWHFCRYIFNQVNLYHQVESFLFESFGVHLDLNAILWSSHGSFSVAVHVLYKPGYLLYRSCNIYLFWMPDLFLHGICRSDDIRHVGGTLAWWYARARAGDLLWYLSCTDISWWLARCSVLLYCVLFCCIVVWRDGCGLLFLSFCDVHFCCIDGR